MRDRLLDWLRCPHDFGRLVLTQAARDAEGCIQTGQLGCESCGRSLSEVCQWFARNQIAVERSNPAEDARGGDGKRRRDHSPVTVMGKKRSLCSELPEAA